MTPTDSQPSKPDFRPVLAGLRLVPADAPGSEPCPRCQGAGWVRLPPAGEGRLALCDAPGCETRRQIDRARLDAVLGTASIPPLYAEAELGSVRQPAAVWDVVRPAMLARRSLLFRGKAGTGKTYFAAALLRGEVEVGREGRFVVVPDLLDRIRRAYGESGPGADAVVEAVESADLLVLDDLGSEKPSEWVREKLYQIVNARILHCRQTLYTTNLAPVELLRQFGERIASRIAGSTVRVTLDGEDRRLGGAKP